MFEDNSRWEAFIRFLDDGPDLPEGRGGMPSAASPSAGRLGSSPDDHWAANDLL